MVGCLFYFAKILFFSSWKLWSWYSFPVFFGVLGYTHALAPLARQSGTRYASFVSAFILSGATLFYFVEFVRPQLRLERVSNFHVINGLAAQRFAPILGGARVAMGDRAGSFAFAYDGPVTQLEGLVNDTEYLRVLSRRGDLKSLLCARHVDYILDYETDLGKYEYHEIKILRPSLTTFNGPTLTVRVTDEVERFYDLGKFDDGKSVERDVYLYLWRLEGC